MPARGMIVAFFAACAALARPAAPVMAQSQVDEKTAQAEVAAAQSAVDEAHRQRALWTTARDALEEAKAALREGDYATAVRAGRFAKEQAELGISQLHYPPFPSKG